MARRRSTTVALFNKGAATDVAVTLLFEDGAEASATFPVAAGARFDVPLDGGVPGGGQSPLLGARRRCRSLRQPDRRTRDLLAAAGARRAPPAPMARRPGCGNTARQRYRRQRPGYQMVSRPFSFVPLQICLAVPAPSRCCRRAADEIEIVGQFLSGAMVCRSVRIGHKTASTRLLLQLCAAHTHGARGLP